MAGLTGSCKLSCYAFLYLVGNLKLEDGGLSGGAECTGIHLEILSVALVFIELYSCERERCLHLPPGFESATSYFNVSVSFEKISICRLQYFIQSKATIAVASKLGGRGIL